MSATVRKTTLRSSDLTCPSCVSKIEKALTALDGVESAEVRFSSGRVVVEHDETRVSKEALVDAVGRAGYTAKVSAF